MQTPFGAETRRPGSSACISPPFRSGSVAGIEWLLLRELLRFAAEVRSSFRVTDVVDGLRLLRMSGGQAGLFCDVARCMEMLSWLGVRFHAKESKRWRPRQSILWLRFNADTKWDASVSHN